MIRRLLAAAGLVTVLGAGSFVALTNPALQSAGTETATARQPDLQVGEVLFNAGGCVSCHVTPGQSDRTRLGGGLALKTPFGTFNVPNLSPHPTDGIGAWSVQDFVRAMRGGVSPRGEHYYPAFPYTSYQRMSATELADMFAYLRTLPVVPGRAPPHDLPFPFSFRQGLGLWKLAFLDGRPFQPDPGRSAEVNRGAFLVEGPGHCGECHSSRNIAGAIIDGRRYAGGPDPEGGEGTTPNITPHASGIAGWTEDDLVEMLTTGKTPNFISVSGSMRSVVANTARLPDADRRAIARYLLSLPPRPAETARKTN